MKTVRVLSVNEQEKLWQVGVPGGLVAAIVFHAFNGVRVILIDFWKKGPKYQRQMLWSVVGLWVITMIGFSVRHLPIVFGGH